MRDILVRRLLQPLYHVSLPFIPSRREKELAYREGLRFRKLSLAWGEEEKLNWVLERLRVVVRHAAACSPYYRKLFRGIGFDPQAPFTFEDYASLPILERTAIHSSGDALILEDISRDELRRDSTGGSTGMPTVVWKGPREVGWFESGVEHFMRTIGLTQGRRNAHLWGHHLDPVVASSLYERLQDVLMNRRWYDCFRLSREVLARYHSELTDWKPEVMICYASALAALAEVVGDEPGRPVYPAAVFITGAEKLYDHHRRLIEAVYTRPVLEQYGSRDVGLIAYQLPPLGWSPGMSAPRFTVDWCNILVGPELGDTVTPILVTKLHADGMPMLRYRIGDLGRFPTTSRDGTPVFEIDEILGREIDRIWLPRGGWVHSASFVHMLRDMCVRDFQVYQAPDFSIEIRIIPDAGFGEATRDAIIRTVRSNVGSLPVRVKLVEDIARTAANKRRPVLSDAQPIEPVVPASR